MTIRIPVLVLSGLLGLTGVVTSAAAEQLRSSIPFAFTAGTQTLPAGTYRVTRPTVFEGLLDIRNSQGGAFTLSPAEESGQADRPPRLVFARYGDRYFLRAVWFSRGRGYTLPPTIEEREQASVTVPETVVSGGASPLAR